MPVYWPITGPQGPTGATGATGPAGAPGTNISVVQSDLFSATVNSGDTGTFSLGGGSGAGVDYTPWPVAGLFSDFYFNTGVAIGGTLDISIAINSVVSALSMTVPNGGFGVISNVVDSVAVVAGDLVSIVITNNSPNPMNNLSGFCLLFTAT